MAHSWLLLGAVAECKPAYTFPCLACKYLTTMQSILQPEDPKHKSTAWHLVWALLPLIIRGKPKWNHFSPNFAYSLCKNFSVSWEQCIYVWPPHLCKYYDYGIWQSSIFTHTTNIWESLAFVGKDAKKKNMCSFFLQNSPLVVNTVLSICITHESYTKLLAWIHMNSSSLTLAWLRSLLRVGGLLSMLPLPTNKR